MIYDIIIAGAGPAGLTAALYARRAGKSVLLIEKESFGGQITLSPLVENYPFAKPMSGMELVNTLVETVTGMDAQVEVDNVNYTAENPDGTITVKTDYSEFTCRTLIIATGLKQRMMGVANEEKFIGRGISYCALCDGAFYKDKAVAVVGGGNTALQDAVYLSTLCSKVYLIHRRDKFRAEEQVVKSLEGHENIELVLNSVPVEIIGEDKVSGIKVHNKLNSEERILEISGIFSAIGHIPNNEMFREIVKLDDAGYIVSGEDCTTDLPNVFAAGDCRTKKVRQLVTANADGAVAATAACAYIDSLKNA